MDGGSPLHASDTRSEVGSLPLLAYHEEDPNFVRASAGLSATQRALRSRAAAGGFAFFLSLSCLLYVIYQLIWHEFLSPTAALAVPVNETPALFLVETIPLLNFSLTLVPGALHTHEVFEGLVNGSTRTLDVSVMYWNLLVRDGDDDAAATPAECAALGCERGLRLYRAFEAAAARGVALRFLQVREPEVVVGAGGGLARAPFAEQLHSDAFPFFQTLDCSVDLCLRTSKGQHHHVAGPHRRAAPARGGVAEPSGSGAVGRPRVVRRRHHAHEGACVGLERSQTPQSACCVLKGARVCKIAATSS